MPKSADSTAHSDRLPDPDPPRPLGRRRPGEQRGDDPAGPGLVELGQEERVEAGLVGRPHLGPQLIEQDVERLLGVLDREDHTETHTGPRIYQTVVRILSPAR